MSAGITAIILAAGYSSRMGAFKPLLPLGGTTILERSIALFRGAGIRDIRVVAGHRSSDLLPLIQSLQARPLLNEHYQEGMFSSVLAAAASLDAGSRAFFLLPVDIPLVSQATVEQLVRACQTSGKGIIYPACHGRRGHPPLIAASYRDAILAWQGSGGLKALLRQYEADAETVETGDEGILLDMDTPQEYGQLQERLHKLAIPSRQACEQLLLGRFEADSPLIGHSRVVARLACLLAERLNRNGCELDLALIEAAALLHDLAKGEPQHAAAGAALLRGLGYAAVADLVAVHMELPPPSGPAIAAADLLYLADKLVEGDRIVPLATRFQRQLDRHAHELPLLAKITRRLECARTIQRRVEERLARPLADLLQEVQS
ncbi:MAG: nucleotidyltransferase family protein [Geobacteraceae bacterium]|nr:nucleotidyltransferase family protein [Geobacteraceae bacterium]